MPNEAGPIRILAVDDHPTLRDGIAAIVQLQDDMVLVGEASNGLEAIEAYQALRPDVTLMDLQMPVMGGVDAIVRIREQAPGARILVLTTYDGDVQASRAMKAGACGYLLKSSLRKELLDTIRLVHQGRRHIPAAIAQEIALHSWDEPLTARETEILKLVAAGMANKSIAWELSVSEDTVKAHMKSIFAKLDVSDRTNAVSVAYRRGIIDF
jgi:DNA-binding NarL/FixJ family response regulator